MAKEVAGQIKLQIKGGAANPSPPIRENLLTESMSDIQRNFMFYVCH